MESQAHERNTPPLNVREKCVDESTIAKFIDTHRGEQLAELHRSAGTCQVAKDGDILPAHSTIV